MVSGTVVPYYGISIGTTHTGMAGGGLALGGYYGVMLHAAGTEHVRLSNGAGWVDLH